MSGQNPKTVNVTTSARKISRGVLRVCLGKLFYQERVDECGNIIRQKRFFTNFNQRLIESGFTPPWVLTREECQKFWSSITDDLGFAGNRPSDYANKDAGINEFLGRFWTPEVSPEDSILEVGCNCGVNLNRLRNLGYRHLSGIEINPHALSEMKRRFPDLAAVATMFLGSLEDLLPTIPSSSVDVVFSMGVLMHVHPKSHHIFSEAVRIARKYIAVIEAETANCGYLFARNYRRVFEQLGCAQLKSALLTKEAFPYVPRTADGLTARLFAVLGE